MIRAGEALVVRRVLRTGGQPIFRVCRGAIGKFIVCVAGAPRCNLCVLVVEESVYARCGARSGRGARDSVRRLREIRPGQTLWFQMRLFLPQRGPVFLPSNITELSPPK